MEPVQSGGRGKDRYIGIRRMILSRVLLAPFVTILLVCGILIYNFATTLEVQVRSKLVQIAANHRHLIDQFLQERTSDLEFIAETFTYEDIIKPDRLQTVFIRLQQNSPAFLDIGIFNSDGNHVSYRGPHHELLGKNYATEPWFRDVWSNGVSISDVFLGYRNIPHFIIAVKREGQGETWYIRATIDTLFFNELVESISMGKTGEAYLINKAGIFQTKSRSGGLLMESDPDRASYNNLEGEIVSFTAKGHDHRNFFYARGILKSVDWLLIVRQQMSDAYFPVIQAVVFALILVSAGGVVVFAMAFMLATSLSGQLNVADMEKRELGNQLIMAGKLAEVGEMSAGIAHEINNPLQIIQSEQYMLKDILGDVEQGKSPLEGESMDLLKDSIDQIAYQIERCKNITHGLLKFARKSEPEFREIAIKPFLDNVTAMIEKRAAIEDVRITTAYAPDLPKLVTSPAHLEQVFLNLFNNAFFALKERDQPEIRIAAVYENQTINLSVTDNGVGITPENITKIFMPFFTTKPVGHGTGLGLSTCYGLVERLGGVITISSELNVGSVFTISLPATQPDVEIKKQQQ